MFDDENLMNMKKQYLDAGIWLIL